VFSFVRDITVAQKKSISFALHYVSVYIHKTNYTTVLTAFSDLLSYLGILHREWT